MQSWWWLVWFPNCQQVSWGTWLDDDDDHHHCVRWDHHHHHASTMWPFSSSQSSSSVNYAILTMMIILSLSVYDAMNIMMIINMWRINIIHVLCNHHHPWTIWSSSSWWQSVYDVSMEGWTEHGGIGHLVWDAMASLGLIHLSVIQKPMYLNGECCRPPMEPTLQSSHPPCTAIHLSGPSWPARLQSRFAFHFHVIMTKMDSVMVVADDIISVTQSPL